jgi:hypothetical protein
MTVADARLECEFYDGKEGRGPVAEGHRDHAGKFAAHESTTVAVFLADDPVFDIQPTKVDCKVYVDFTSHSTTARNEESSAGAVGVFLTPEIGHHVAFVPEGCAMARRKRVR